MKIFQSTVFLLIHSERVNLLLLNPRPDLELLEETRVAEIFQKNNKNIFFVVLYRHPNETAEESQVYFSSLNDIVEKLANEKPMAIVLTGDFDASSSLFWENDADTREGPILIELVIVNNLVELVNEPTHVHDDGTQTCIDLMVTKQPYAFTNVEVIPPSQTVI